MAPPPKFLRNTLDISDLPQKKSAPKSIKSPKNETVEGSEPSKLFRTVEAVSRLSVKDINDDGKFVSRRRNNPTDPLNPSYEWRDRSLDQKGFVFTKPILEQDGKNLNNRYGDI